MSPTHWLFQSSLRAVRSGSQTSANGTARRNGTSATTPTTVKARPSRRTVRPTAGALPKSFRRVASFTTATAFAAASSASVNGPPSRKRKLSAFQNAPSALFTQSVSRSPPR